MKRDMAKILMLVLSLVLMFTITCSTSFAKENTPLLVTSNPVEADTAGVNLTEATVTVCPADMVYIGTTIVPNIAVSMNGKTLIAGVDYTMNLPEIKNAGTYTIGITGLGNYIGTTGISFRVLPANLSNATIKIDRPLTTADLDSDKKLLIPSVMDSIVHVEQNGIDLKRLCTLKTSVTDDTITVSASISNGDGINAVNSSLSKSFELKTNMSDCLIGGIATHVYSGEAYTPSINVYNRLTGETLRHGVDYTVGYKDTINAGYGVVTATGIGKYTGSVTSYFEIEPKNLYNCIVFFTNGRSSSVYTGKEMQPLVTVRDGAKKVLIQNQDYSVTYLTADVPTVTQMQEAGKYTVAVKGMNNYTGKIELQYQIIGTDVDGYKITLRYDKVKADGTAKKPEILSVKLGETSMLTTSEYDVSYLDPSGNPVTEMIKPGVYTVVVTAKNGFSGTITTTFEIVGAEQEITGVKNTYKAYKKTANFKLEPVASGDGTGFTFESSDPSVATVSADGVVDVKKLGRAVITIKTVGETVYQPAEKSVIVMVYPYKAVMTQKPWTDGAKKSFKVRWETQPDVTYYQVRYSRNKNFKSGSYNTKKVTQNTKGYATQSTTIKNLKSGQKYYVKVRAVKVVENELGEKLYYYGTWSSWKSVKTK